MLLIDLPYEPRKLKESEAHWHISYSCKGDIESYTTDFINSHDFAAKLSNPVLIERGAAPQSSLYLIISEKQTS
jgi:hypothetical protein